MLNQEIQALEMQSTVNARYINEAVQLYEQNSLHELFQGNERASLHLYIHVWIFSKYYPVPLKHVCFPF